MWYKIKRVLTWINEEYNDMQWFCPDGFHVPLQSEWSWLYTIMSWLSLTTWNNWVTNLHLPFAWRRQYDGTQYAWRWTFGQYRSSSYKGSGFAYILSFESSVVFSSMVTSYGLSIRPFKNSFVAPTSWWTVITWTLGWAWIFWDQTDWIISITSNGSTWYTIADKNLWATVVYNDWDTLSESNCWKCYQRWNNYWFPRNASVTTANTQVNASTYWPWNYYTSSVYLTYSGWWDSSYNANLRWWVTQWSWTRLVEKQIYPSTH